MHNCSLPETRNPYVLAPIGVIRTPFHQQAGTPIQSAVADGAEGVIELRPELITGLRDLEGFERLWLIYFLDRITTVQLETTPYLDTQPHGVFATRAPARPNPLGLSPVRLLRIEGCRLFVADVDMLDGTPLLDIKPYIPSFDAFSAARIGWYSGKSIDGAVADERFTGQRG